MTQRRINILITLLVTLLFFVIFFDRIVIINGPATASVIFRPFSGGIDMKKIYKEGVYFVWPWNSVYKYNTREQVVEDTVRVMVDNGVTITIVLNYRYSPDIDSLPDIFKRYGPDYHRVFVHPEIIANTRDYFSYFSPEQLYTRSADTTKNGKSATDPDTTNPGANDAQFAKRRIYNLNNLQLNSKLKAGHVFLSDLVVTHLQMPDKVVQAIEKKLQQEQLAQEYDFRITIAQKEQQIKVIEAQATKMAEDTVNAGLTEGYLQLRQIEAFQNLSNSPNTKIIITPRGTNTPIILNDKQ